MTWVNQDLLQSFLIALVLLSLLTIILGLCNFKIIASPKRHLVYYFYSRSKFPLINITFTPGVNSPHFGTLQNKCKSKKAPQVPVNLTVKTLQNKPYFNDPLSQSLQNSGGGEMFVKNKSKVQWLKLSASI